PTPWSPRTATTTCRICSAPSTLFPSTRAQPSASAQTPPAPPSRPPPTSTRCPSSACKPHPATARHTSAQVAQRVERNFRREGTNNPPSGDQILVPAGPTFHNVFLDERTSKCAPRQSITGSSLVSTALRPQTPLSAGLPTTRPCAAYRSR